jgi:hypothetical protein
MVQKGNYLKIKDGVWQLMPKKTALGYDSIIKNTSWLEEEPKLEKAKWNLSLQLIKRWYEQNETYFSIASNMYSYCVK